ncbi:general secretory system II protein E domain-containing protein [Clavibacter tessellarius]|uniref:General secretory system II protein E domain-containing protein n=2 Tax=Clavibacter tessellarius TaxID=31965 RepID=A0A154V3T0_9MICO|nr:general secretory system II protein E domain-containing protein [Clavibacter michiganensis subsp. tessellarius]
MTTADSAPATPAPPTWQDGIDPGPVRQGPRERYLAEGWIPVRLLADGRQLVAADDRRRNPGFAAALAAELGAPVALTRVDAWELKDAVLRLCGEAVADDAANRLFRANPELSGRLVFSRGQKAGALVGAVLLVALAVVWPRQTAVGALSVVSLAFLAATAFKFFVALQGARYDVVDRVTEAEVHRLVDADLPVYTVLVPVFREANIVAQLIENLGGLDYPAHKLEVLILIEEEDSETRDAIVHADPPAHFHIVTIPAGQPQTKPRACNVGLTLASGEYLVIYDAEDTPDPDQLKKALVAFDRGGPEMVCVQAALNYFNASENALTRMFTLEYSYWFDYMLAGLDHSNLPIPLGGTSNHFRTAALVELGGWDPYNVTEDADLGIRASAVGYRVGVINSTTMEEANTSIPNFIRQRSRWIKGYMQTTLVHARRPVALIREVGIVRFVAFALLIGGTPATFLGVIPFYLVTIASLAIPNEVIASVFPAWALWTSLFNFLVGNGVMVYVSMMGPFKRGTFHLILWSLLNPVYWILHSISAYKGLWQLLTRPHYWEKTEHGLTQQ